MRLDISRYANPKPVVPEGAKVYIVGGTVRDLLRGKTSDDVDFCVVGATEAGMESLGYKQVGAAFPVFLDDSRRQLALARLEKKTGVGYNGFEVSTSGVTLEDDLRRRDFTINSIAVDIDSEEVIDPFGGVDDINSKILRATSAKAFVEDPVRALRLARFAARFSDFAVDEGTVTLAKAITKEDYAAVPGDRLRLEFEKMWKTAEDPIRFFHVLIDTGVLALLFPEINALLDIRERPEYHPEGNTFVHTMLTLSQMQKLGPYFGADCFWMMLTHDFGKAMTPDTEAHINHEDDGIPIVEGFCDRLRLPAETKRLCVSFCKDHLRLARSNDQRPGKIETILANYKIEQEYGSKFFYKMVVGCMCDWRGRLGLHDCAVPFVEDLSVCENAFVSVKGGEVVQSMKDAGKEPTGAEIGYEIRQRRIKAIKHARAVAKKKVEVVNE